jgi:lysozyme family protein
MAANYEYLFSSAQVEQLAQIDAAVDRILANKSRYQTVANRLGNGMPYWVVGVIHSLEASNNFNKHLHNGDPLTSRTVNVPVGRPATGTPPFRWEDSALDALKSSIFASNRVWDIDTILYKLESYNGGGYRKRGVLSPYIWAFTNHYTKGKFVKDGVFDPNAVSKQPGAAAIIKRLFERGKIQLAGIRSIYGETQTLTEEVTLQSETGLVNIDMPPGSTVSYPAKVLVVENFDSPEAPLLQAEASVIATSAVTSVYPPQEAASVLQKFAGSLSGSPSFLTTLSMLIINSQDFFQKRVSSVLSPAIPENAIEKKKLLEKIRNNPLSPLKKTKKTLSIGTSLTPQEIKDQLVGMGIQDEIAMQISDKDDLVNYVLEKGYGVTEEIDPLQELEELLQEELDFEKEKPYASLDEVYSCPDGELPFQKFNPSELNDLAKQCCEPSEESQEDLEIPELEDIPEMTEEEINDFLEDIDNIAQDMSKCASERADASEKLEKLNRVREDFYSLYTYFRERKEYLEKIDKKEVKPILNVSLAEKTALLATVGVFSIDVFFSRSILYPSTEKDTSQYSNQSGLNPSDKKSYFLIVEETTPFLKEIEESLKNSKPSSAMNDFIVSKEVPKNLETYKKTPVGTYYREFLDKYNSPDRVDFLFSYEEQGYLTPKPTANDLVGDKAEEKLNQVKIDEDKSSEFLRNYPVLEKTRALEKIQDLKNSDYFVELVDLARKEASRIVEIENILTLNPIRLAIVRGVRERVFAEFVSAEAVWKEIEKRITEIEKSIEEKEKCIQELQSGLESKYGSEDENVNLTPGNDPFGGSPPDAFQPGITKNFYWKEFTKKLQTVSFMPIPDLKNLNKRLFRYYPVGLQIQLPTPPTTLPTLASGIPDTRISIPFPILWKHLATLSTPAGQFVLWLTYCPPFTIFPYLMYIDENLNCSFLTTPKGGLQIPAKSLNWDDQSAIAKSVVERIPGLKIPLKSLPQADNSVSTKDPDDKKNALQDLRNRIKAAIDKLDSSPVLTQKRIERRTKLKTFRDKIKATLDVPGGYIDTAAVTDFLGEIKKMVREDVNKMIDFETLTIPKTQKKRSDPPIVNEFRNLTEKIKSLKRAGAPQIQSKKVDVEAIMKSKILKIIDSKEGREIARKLDESLSKIENQAISASAKNEKIAEEVTKSFKNLVEKAISKVTPKDLGYVPVPKNLSVSFLPVPAKPKVEMEPMPLWVKGVNVALKGLSNKIVSVGEEIIRKGVLISVGRGFNLPSGRELLLQVSNDTMEPLLKSIQVPIPGWPNDIFYPTSISLLNQTTKNTLNSIWKTKLRINVGGIPPIKITPDLVKSIADPLLDSAIDIVFSVIVQEFTDVAFEQNSGPSIKLQNSLLVIRTIFGSELWDIQEQDIKTASVLFLKDALQKADASILSLMTVLDSAKKTSSSFTKNIAKFSKQKTSLDQVDGPMIDIGSEITNALYMGITAKLISGEIQVAPFPAVLLASSLGNVGWQQITKIDPFRAIEKLPPFERLSLRNIPFVLWLDFLATTAQRHGGIGCNYVVPYFTPET